MLYGGSSVDKQGSPCYNSVISFNKFVIFDWETVLEDK